MANAGSSVILAAQAVREQAIELALSGEDAPFAKAHAEDVVIADGALALRGRTCIGFAELLARNGLSSLVGDGDYDPVEEVMGRRRCSASALSSRRSGSTRIWTVRLNRFLAAYDAGRIINPKTARSQAIGGIIWGVGQALLEQTETDPHTAGS